MMNETKTKTVKISPIAAWFYAARPKTLAAAAVPVITAGGLAYADGVFAPIPVILALMFALFAQIAANFVNDWSDYQKGADTQERLGPDRMTALGVISPRAMLIGTFIALGIACGFGLGLVPFGGVKLIFVGAVCAVFALLYSAGPMPLAYIGLGDAAVILFFGLVAVGGTYYVQAHQLNWNVLLMGGSVGLAADLILTANNYRDRDEDRENRKWTLIARWGERFGRYFYLMNGLGAAVLFGLVVRRYSSPITLILPLLWLTVHIQTWREMVRIQKGKELNRILEQSAKNLLLLGALAVIVCLIR